MKEITIGFEVFGYPESSGLRIRTTNSIHLYISGQDADAVKWHFETGVVEFIVRERLLSWEGLQGLGLKEEIKLIGMHALLPERASVRCTS